MMIDLRCFGMLKNGTGKSIDFFGFVLPLGILIALWINDTCAYLVGSFIGKTPFSKISPKKTWEGTVGGAVLYRAVRGAGAEGVEPLDGGVGGGGARGGSGGAAREWD